MSKKRQSMEEIPIDKVEHFLQNNFQKILMVVGGAIVLVLIAFMVQKNTQAKTAVKYNQLGMQEVYLITGKADQAQIDEYLSVGYEIPDMKDYVNYNVALYYLNKGDEENTIKYLQQTGGIFTELKDSLLYDLGELKTVSSSYLNNSHYSTLWEYRNILNMTNSENKDKAIETFKTSHPDSRLVELLDNWES